MGILISYYYNIRYLIYNYNDSNTTSYLVIPRKLRTKRLIVVQLNLIAALILANMGFTLLSATTTVTLDNVTQDNVTRDDDDVRKRQQPSAILLSI